MKKRLLALLLIALMLVSLLPAAALAAEPAADAVVKLTVSNAGTLALARAEVTVKDLDEDGKLTYDEALVAAHAAYCPDGYAVSEGWVTKLWGVANGSYMFYNNDVSIPNGVGTDTVKEGDELTIAVMSDTATYGDVYTYFTEKDVSMIAGMGIYLHLKASSFNFSNVPGAGLQAGTWKDGTFTPIEGAVADADGEVAVTFDTPGTYVISATGTIKDTVTTDWTTGATEEKDCPIIAPVCTVKVMPPEIFDYDGDSLNFIKLNGDAFGMYRVQNGSSAVLSEDGENVDIVFYPNNKKTYKGFYLYALIDNKEMWKEENLLTAASLSDDEPYGVYTFSVSKDLCGKAVAIAPVKAKDGTTTGDQYYIAIPAADKLPYYAPARDAEVKLTVSNAGTLALARADVTVKDIDKDGKLTYDEALVAAHEAYCPDGYAAEPSSYGGLFVTKLWNVSNGGSYMFYNNDVSIPNGVGTDTVKDGDELTAAVMSDTATYGDIYTYFTDKTAETKAGESVELTLKASSYNLGTQPVAGAGLHVGIWDEVSGMFIAVAEATTDAEGKVTLTREEPGTYIISAQGTMKATVTTDWTTGATEEKDCPIIAPVCVLTVKPQPAEDAEVFVTISKEGVLALARETVTVKDINEDGKLSYDEALVAAHAAFCPDGYALKESSYGMSVVKLWGVENGGNYQFFVNDVAIGTGVVEDTVKAGDELNAAVMTDTSYASDYYAWFDTQTKTVEKNEEFTLTLSVWNMMQDYGYYPEMEPAGLQIGTWADGTFTPIEGLVTGEDGKVTLSFADPGTFVVSAGGTLDYEGIMDMPIIAPICVVTVTGPANDADVYVTVAKEGELVLAHETVTVKDLNADGVLSYDEALVATHEAYCPDGYALKETSYGKTVSKLWGVENGGNYQFYVNDVAIGTGVVEDTVKAGDELNAAVMTDTSYASDYYVYFDTQTKTVPMGEEFTLTTKAWNMLQDWGYYPELSSAGLQVGTWADGTFTAIEGAVIGEDETVALTFDEPGTYIVTAAGELDYEGIMDMPVIPPICVVKVSPPLQFDYDGTELKMINYSGANFGMFAPQEGSKVELSADGKTATVTLIPKNGTIYKGFYVYASIDDEATRKEENYIAAAANADNRPYGIYEFTLGEEYIGKATAIVPIKAKDGGTTADQYYIAIPGPDDAVKPAFKSQSLVLSGQIAVKFNLELPEIEGVDYKDSYVEFTVGKSAPVKVGYDQATLGTNGRYGFLCYVKSIQMADTITAVFHYGDGKTVSKEYSVEQYIKKMDTLADQYDAKTMALIHAIADYGHYAQLYLSEVNKWEIGTDYKAMNTFYATTYDYAGILSTVTPKAFVKTLGSSDVEKATYKLHLDAETTVDVYLTPKSGKTLTASATFNGKTYTAEKQSDGRYLVRIPNISAHLLGDMITIKGTAGSEFTVQVCALSYVRSVLNNAGSTEAAKNGLSSLYAYYEATMAYRKK